ncbi:MAG: hypothetical protein LUQ42_05550 [Methanomicrobiales archaeon]|jgi:hypothetical protein|nr:hypothetical protein [Methanomicrobiales archaeon]
MQKNTIAALVFFLSTIILGGFAYNYSQDNSYISIRVEGETAELALGVYKDVTTQERLTTMDWGTLNISESKTFDAYMKNEGNVPANVAIRTINWNPPNASECIFITWNDVVNTPLNPNRIRKIIFTCYVAYNVTYYNITKFSSEIIISLSQ